MAATCDDCGHTYEEHYPGSGYCSQDDDCKGYIELGDDDDPS